MKTGIKALFLIMVFLLIPAIASGEEAYKIGAGDVLEVHAWDAMDSDLLIVNPILPGLTQAYIDPHSVTVSRDGKIYIPMLGSLYVKGMDVKRLESILRTGLRRYAKGSNVTVMIKTPKSITVNIAGEVRNPGAYNIPDGRLNELSLLNYIKNAGGYTEDADIDEIEITKMNGSKRTVDLRKMMNENDISQNVTLHDGDTVVVPQSVARVYVLGQVTRPGGVKFINGSTVISYIAMAGGLLKTAASDNIGVVRGDPGNPVVKKVKVNRFANYDSQDTQIAVLPGDIIFVPMSWYYNWSDVASLIVGYRDARDASIDLISPNEWKLR
ncbi:MAG: polysaccharide export protein [Candidatus Saganbacteria bacterium]|nr:polysaccharide export protein [Candidatus Saganbacteria bacterium]